MSHSFEISPDKLTAEEQQFVDKSIKLLTDSGHAVSSKTCSYAGDGRVWRMARSYFDLCGKCKNVLQIMEYDANIPDEPTLGDPTLEPDWKDAGFLIKACIPHLAKDTPCSGVRLIDGESTPCGQPGVTWVIDMIYGKLNTRCATCTGNPGNPDEPYPEELTDNDWDNM